MQRTASVFPSYHSRFVPLSAYAERGTKHLVSAGWGIVIFNIVNKVEKYQIRDHRKSGRKEGFYEAVV